MGKPAVGFRDIEDNISKLCDYIKLGFPEASTPTVIAQKCPLGRCVLLTACLTVRARGDEKVYLFHIARVHIELPGRDDADAQ